MLQTAACFVGMAITVEDKEWNMLENMKELACNCRGSANNLALHWMALTVSTCSSIGWTLVDLVEIRSGSSVRVAYDKGLKTTYDSFSSGFGLTWFFTFICLFYFFHIRNPSLCDNPDLEVGSLQLAGEAVGRWL